MMNAWHAADANTVLATLETSHVGLSSPQIAGRRQKYGLNRLPQAPPVTCWQVMIRQFQNPLIYILLAAAAVAVLSGDLQDAGFIGLVLALNTGIGGYQEWRAEKSSRALQQLLKIRASVVRDGEVEDVDAEELVPGDVVWLESGNRVPADLRLLTAHDFEVDESLLTGESISVTKDAKWIGEESTPVADRLNTASAASIVIRGRASGVVVATGSHTVVGQLAIDVVSSSGGKPPLLERMEKFSQTIAYTVILAVGAVAVMGIVIHHYSLKEMFLLGVALAVSAIPEGLPAALTVALAVATARMARRGVIVRRLAAVEGLGSCTMIASDKTGTLTCNELTVRKIHLADGSDMVVTGQGFAPTGAVLYNDATITASSHPMLSDLLTSSLLCNEADLHRRDEEWTWRGDPTDIALLSLGQKAGLKRVSLINQYPQVNEIPFESEHQFAATYHKADSAVRVHVKGAPERILEMCRWNETDRQKNAFHQIAESMAAQGLRVLGVADGNIEMDLRERQLPPKPQGLRFLGFVGMIDPLRAGVREAVETCHQAGIAVFMVTGDHPVTALAIARDLGLASTSDQVVSGVELSKWSPEEMRTAIRTVRVFARVAPRQKLQLVEAARAEGHFVAVTGDGVNDAPAMRAANIGVAMGKSGTDVAREAAELVISDDNFATIVSGIEEGRIAYDNVRKVIYLLISTGAAEVLLIGGAFAVGTLLPLPLLPVQLLWLNLVTNGIQGVALAFEPGEAGILQRKPRQPNEPIFNRLMIEQTLVAAFVMATVGLLAFWWMLREQWSLESARNALLLLLVLFENVHIGNCRSERRSAFGMSPLRSPFLLAGALGALGVHLIGMHLPILQSVLHTEPVSLPVFLSMFGLSLSVLLGLEIHKFIWHLRGR